MTLTYWEEEATDTGLAGGDSERNIQAIALFALLLSFASFSFVNLVTRPVACFPGDIGTPKCPLTSAQGLGTWYNMPAASTELMGNTSYRQVYSPPVGGFNFPSLSAYLQVGCITISNTVGAQLQLQYALYSQSNSIGNRITTGFQNVGGPVFIDGNGALANACGGSDQGTSTIGALNTTGAGYIFRVIGSGGGGIGDNPRFSYVSVVVSVTEQRLFQAGALSPSTTGFSAYVRTSFPVATTVTFQWTATNLTSSTLCGVNGSSLDHCVEGGKGQTCTLTLTSTNNQCVVAITFATAFTGTVTAVATTTTVGAGVTLTTAQFSLLQAQTLTV